MVVDGHFVARALNLKVVEDQLQTKRVCFDHCFVHRVADFIRGLEGGKPARPDFKDGLACDYVVDAVLASGKSKTWQKVQKPKGWK